jgi:hypothetical protein
LLLRVDLWRIEAAVCQFTLQDPSYTGEWAPPKDFILIERPHALLVTEDPTLFLAGDLQTVSIVLVLGRVTRKRVVYTQERLVRHVYVVVLVVVHVVKRPHLILKVYFLFPRIDESHHPLDRKGTVRIYPSDRALSHERGQELSL